MKISRLIIAQHQQFDFLDLDLTYPAGHDKAGKPLDKVCFIGPNGTGKTTLLEHLNWFLALPPSGKKIKSKALFEVVVNEKQYLIGAPQKFRTGEKSYYVNPDRKLLFPSNKENEKKLINLIIEDGRKGYPEIDLPEEIKNWYYLFDHRVIDTSEIQVISREIKGTETIYSPLDTASNKLLSTGLVPETQLNDALKLFKDFPHEHIISFETVKEFWDLVTYQVKKRESDREAFENAPENINKTKKQLIEEFETNNPDFLEVLAKLWNPILAEAGLFFDHENAKKPVQLTDNLLAYIKVKATGENLPYQKLSTGLRHIIFRLGYFAAIYFNREVPSAIALFDEPENSLFPTIQYKLLELYQSVAQNTQFFFATHSPIIAAQFEPCERILLNFNEQGYVVAEKGVAPEGDDPNDVLRQDFGQESVYSQKGREMYARFQELRRLIRFEEDQHKKLAYSKEYMDIGNQYNFYDEKTE